MNDRTLRIALIILDFFLALTAIGGGVALLAGFGAPPVDMLAGSPFTDYTIPGLALLLLVGGGALLAGILTLRRHSIAPLASGVVGLMIVLFELVEVYSIGSPAGASRNLQVFYLLLGAVIIALAFLQWRAGQARNPR